MLSKLIGRKEEVVLGSFPHVTIGLISAMPQLAGISRKATNDWLHEEDSADPVDRRFATYHIHHITYVM